MSSQKYIFIPIIIVGVLLIHYHLNTLEKHTPVTTKDIGAEVTRSPPTENIIQGIVKGFKLSRTHTNITRAKKSVERLNDFFFQNITK